jgi:hypothetical protein
MPLLISEPDMLEGVGEFLFGRGGGHGSRGGSGFRSRQLRTPRTFLSWGEPGSSVSSCPGSLSRRAIRSVVPLLSNDH